MIRAILLALSVLAGIAGAAAAPCTPLADWTLEADWYGGMTVPMPIAGRPLPLLIDTGGVRSMLTGSTVADLKLKAEPLSEERVTLYGGLAVTERVRVAGTEPSDFYVMPDGRVPYALAGTLAPDFLSHYDVALDFAAARMRLYPPGACATGEALTLANDPSHHLIVTVELDGRKIPAMLDTGASRSDMSLETARRLFGRELREVPARRADCEDGIATHPFAKLTIGGVIIEHPDIVLVPDAVGGRPADSPRLVLGMGVLRQLSLTVFYSRGEIRIARAGS